MGNMHQEIGPGDYSAPSEAGQPAHRTTMADRVLALEKRVSMLESELGRAARFMRILAHEVGIET